MNKSIEESRYKNEEFQRGHERDNDRGAFSHHLLIEQ
jgi:hypothetical protein